MKDKMRNTMTRNQLKMIVVYSLIILLLTQNLFAQGDGASDGSSDASQNVDYSSPTSVNNLDSIDLATAIEQGKISDLSIITDENLVSALDSRPSISRELPDIDLVRALNKDSSLLERSSVLNEIFIEVSQRTQNNPDILNDNSNIKKVWFNRFGIKDEGAGISSYSMNDQQITIKGTVQGKEEVRTTFDLLDVPPKSRVLSDGTLVTRIGNFKNIEGLSKQRDANDQPVQIDGVDVYSVIGGGVEVNQDDPYLKKASFVTSCADDSPESCTTLAVRISKNNLPNEIRLGYIRRVTPTGATILYKGSFKFTQTKEGIQVIQEGDKPFLRETSVTYSWSNKNEKETLTTHKIYGGIIDRSEKKQNLDEFLLLDKTTISESDLTKINYETGTPGNRLYYSEQQNAVCPPKFSCLINTAGHSSDDELHRGNLIFRNVKDTDTVAVNSVSYFNKVQGDHLEGGKAIFRTIEPVKKQYGDIYIVQGGDKVISEITMSGRDQISITGGKLIDTNAGRIDMLYNDGTEEKMIHWSSNKGYKTEDSSVKNYFKNRENSFVTCSIKNDCEEEFAESFGTIIPGKDINKRPAATIIIAGDTSSTAQTLYSFCKINGCYILNSRDAPQTTGSNTIVIAGHHYGRQEGIWRDAPNAPETSHNPIDIYTTNDFPIPRTGVEVKAFKSSACNTNLKPRTNPVTGTIDSVDMFSDMYSLAVAEKYPDAIIEGWDGTAPLNEPIKGIVSNPGMIKQNCYSSADGRRTWRYKDAQGVNVWTDCKNTMTFD